MIATWRQVAAWCLFRLGKEYAVMSTRVALELDTLSCVEETEHGSEPYIWPILIAEEAGVTTLHVPHDDFAAIVLASEMQAGQSIAVPQGMDGFVFHTFNDASAGLAVLLVALFEKDQSPRHGSVAVFRHIEERSVQFVQDRLAEFRQSSGQRDDLRNALISRFDLAAAESGALSIPEQALTAILPGGFDDSIGFVVFAFSGPALTTRNISFPLNRGSDRFTLTGRIQLSIVLPPRCHAERDLVAQAEEVVKGLQGQRHALQQQLQHATPQQKPAIIDLIQRIAEVDLPAAEAALAQAEAVLSACEERFHRDPILDPVILG
jgi:hypothetical protein